MEDFYKLIQGSSDEQQLRKTTERVVSCLRQSRTRILQGVHQLLAPTIIFAEECGDIIVSGLIGNVQVADVQLEIDCRIQDFISGHGISTALETRKHIDNNALTYYWHKLCRCKSHEDLVTLLCVLMRNKPDLKQDGIVMGVMSMGVMLGALQVRAHVKSALAQSNKLQLGMVVTDPSDYRPVDSQMYVPDAPQDTPVYLLDDQNGQTLDKAARAMARHYGHLNLQF